MTRRRAGAVSDDRHGGGEPGTPIAIVRPVSECTSVPRWSKSQRLSAGNHATCGVRRAGRSALLGGAARSADADVTARPGPGPGSRRLRAPSRRNVARGAHLRRGLVGAGFDRGVGRAFGRGGGRGQGALELAVPWPEQKHTTGTTLGPQCNVQLSTHHSGGARIPVAEGARRASGRGAGAGPDGPLGARLARPPRCA